MLQSQIWNPCKIFLRNTCFNCSVTYIFCEMGIFKRLFTKKLKFFVKFENAINKKIKGQITKQNWSLSIWVTRITCMDFYQNLGRSRVILHFFRGDLSWNDPEVRVRLKCFLGSLARLSTLS